MPEIKLLDNQTIDKIAAGEVVEKPASVVKELVENAMDAGANAITVEIKGGGIDLIRITDDGCGIPAEEVPKAFLRHATSKIQSDADLFYLQTLGFRGEALASIAAVAQVEMITKTKDSLTGTRITIEGGIEKEIEEVGAPNGTTIIIRNLFYNVPARKKFLKSAMTEGSYIVDLMQHMAQSMPGMSFKLIVNNDVKFHTSGNGDLKEVIYQIYGREITANLLEVKHIEESAGISVAGFIGKPVVSRGNRNYENYFINGRYIKSSVVSRAIEEAYRSYMMQHKYPFTALHISMDTAMIDVNVHPTKLEVRFTDSEAVYYAVYHAVRDALAGKNMIPQVGFGKEEKSTPVELPKKEARPEQFETVRMAQQTMARPVKPMLEKKPEVQAPKVSEQVLKTPVIKPVAEAVLQEEKAPYEIKKTTSVSEKSTSVDKDEKIKNDIEKTTIVMPEPEQPKQPVEIKEPEPVKEPEQPKKPEQPVYVQEQMELPNLLSEDNKKEYRIVGQLFATYWLIEMEGQLFMIDQHAAHEKILFEQTMKRIREKEMLTQQIAPPFIASLSLREEEVLMAQADVLRRLGFEFEHFGGRDYKVTGVPADLCGLTGGELFIQLLDELVAEKLHGSPEVLVEKVASMSCKAAVKGNMVLSETEAKAMIDLLLTLDNPYHCPHGRPTTISMTKQEIEKKFKRIV